MTAARIVTEKRVRTDDGVELYARETRTLGSSATPIICANGIGVSTFFWNYIERDLAPERPVIVWDYRGHGKSGRPRDLDELTMRRNARDLVAVLDAFAVPSAVLIGHSMGVQVVFETYRIAASRVSALVPMFGTFGRPIDTFYELPIASPLGFMFAHRLISLFPKKLGSIQSSLLKNPKLKKLAAKLARLARLVDPEKMPDEHLDAYIEHFGDFDPEVFIRMAEKMAVHTAGDLLEKVLAPVLVVAGDKDLFTPLWLSEEMADRLPNARLLMLKNGSHAGMVEQPELVNGRLRKFLADAIAEAPAPRAKESRVT